MPVLRPPRPADRWAEQEVVVGIIEGAGSVDVCWSFVLRLLASAPDERVLGTIGASPIEDLLARDPALVAGWIEAEALSSPRLRTALTHVWQMPSVPTTSSPGSRAWPSDQVLIRWRG